MKDNNNQNEKCLDYKKVSDNYEDIINNNKLNSFSNYDFNKSFKNLATPSFLGSYHMKKSLLNKETPINHLLKGNLELKYTKSLRNVIFNPITITLIILALLFNFFWFFLMFT